jgi:uncharacterized membrane protein
LSLVALALSAYLAWHHVAGSAVIGCGDGSPCDQVLASRWSAIGGRVPVSGLAMGVYLAILVAVGFVGPRAAPADRRLAWGAMLVLAGAAVGSAVWFTIVQHWIIKAFCPYCLATHVIGLLLAVMILWRATRPDLKPEQSSPARPVRLLGPVSAMALLLVGLGSAGILAGAQIALTPPPAYRAGTSERTAPPVEARAVPLAGPPTARHIVTLFFDYNCFHCMRLHGMLEETIARYDGKLAFVLCPAPLSSQCNPYVANDREEFRDSCDLARTALAVWVARREEFPTFDNWMFWAEPGRLWRPRNLEAARAKAVELVGQEAFDAALADPWIDRYLQASVRSFGEMSQGGSAVPKLVLGARWVTPEVQSADDLVQVLQAGLGLPQP